MKTSNTTIVNKAAGILLNRGLEALTVQNLSKELRVKESQLHNQLTKDEDIILMLLYAFEADFNEFVKEMKTQKVNPETELKILFKGLYFMFLQKPHYLSLVFDKRLTKRDDRVKQTIFRIKSVAEVNLADIINYGKKQNTFKTNEPTEFLVRKILAGFRLFMKDEKRLNDMVLELKTLKIISD